MKTLKAASLALIPLLLAGATARAELPPNTQDIETVCRYVFGDFDTNHVMRLVGKPSPSGGLGPETCDAYISCSTWGSGTFAVSVSDRSSRGMHGFTLNRYTRLLDNLKSLESDVILMSDRYFSHTQKLHVMMTYIGGQKKVSAISFEYMRNPSGGFVDVPYPSDFRCENLEPSAN